MLYIRCFMLITAVAAVLSSAQQIDEKCSKVLMRALSTCDQDDLVCHCCVMFHENSGCSGTVEDNEVAGMLEALEMKCKEFTPETCAEYRAKADNNEAISIGTGTGTTDKFIASMTATTDINTNGNNSVNGTTRSKPDLVIQTTIPDPRKIQPTPSVLPEQTNQGSTFGFPVYITVVISLIMITLSILLQFIFSN